MSAKLVVGLDGEPSGGRALAYAQHMAKLIGSCEIIVVFVVEWSPYSFQTAEENAARHKRREAEISIAMERVVQPALDELAARRTVRARNCAPWGCGRYDQSYFRGRESRPDHRRAIL